MQAGGPHRGGAQPTLATTTDGQMYTWGEGSNEKQGHGNRRGRTVPERVGAVAGIQVMAAAGGVDISLALGAGGEVYSWGWTQSERLGQGGYGDEMVPRRVNGLESVRVIHVNSFFLFQFYRSFVPHRWPRT